jgi:hypothetical protein
VDLLLNAAAAVVVVAVGQVEVGTACGFAADPSQEAHGSCLKKTPQLQEAFTSHLHKRKVPYCKQHVAHVIQKGSARVNISDMRGSYAV